MVAKGALQLGSSQATRFSTRERPRVFLRWSERVFESGLFLPSIGFKNDFWIPIELDIKLRYQIIGKLTGMFLSGSFPTLLLCITSPYKVSILEATNALRETYGLTRRTIEHYDVATENHHHPS